MPLPIEDYALIGDLHTAALVGRDGSIDWLCLPRFDAGACFAALLGTPDHGRWRIAPLDSTPLVRRRYRDDTLILETEFETGSGTVRLIDVMPIDDTQLDVLRIVEGVDGEVEMDMELVIRFDYGSEVPWVRKEGAVVLATAGPHTLALDSPVPTHGEGLRTVARFTVAAGDRLCFGLRYRPSHESGPPDFDIERSLRATEDFWKSWSARCTYQGIRRDAVIRSLLTLKALIYRPTGGVIAAPTTSLPEQPGGVRNWDYRFCWLRDATFTLDALLLAGFDEEAQAWVQWLLRAVAGRPEALQTLYSVTGERRLDERTLEWLPGYQGAAPVRIGNAAVTQFQLDVYGEVMDTLHLARAAGLSLPHHAWRIQVALLDFLTGHWRDPDEGIWEIRGPRRHFTYSKVMAWVAFDRAIQAVERFGLDGPVQAWRETRAAIHRQVCEAGYDTTRGCFVQHYDTRDLDASLLLIAQVGFLPADDPRVLRTIAAVEADLRVDGVVLRYPTEHGVDHLPPGEGAFLPCSFWLVDAMVLTGRHDEARALFEHLLTMGNDVGLFSEEYDPNRGCMLGNFPQALTHMALVNSARLLNLHATRGSGCGTDAASSGSAG